MRWRPFAITAVAPERSPNEISHPLALYSLLSPLDVSFRDVKGALSRDMGGL